MGKNIFSRIAPAILGLTALALMSVPTVGAMERDGTPMGFAPQWYDPQAWFERGGPLAHEADWYDYTFAYRQSEVHGYLGPHGEPMPFGYFGERPMDESSMLYDRPIELNYYTTDWYRREGTLARWLEERPVR